MKNLIWIIVIFFSCTNAPNPVNKPTVDTTKQIACDFGIDSNVFAENSRLSSRRPRPNDPPPVTPTPVYGNAVILLDFDGHTVSGTAWNWQGTDIVMQPSGLDTASMTEIISHINQKLSKWRIAVSTNEADYNSADIKRRVRVIFTTSWEWHGQSAGVSYKRSFTDGSGSPCFVFTSLLNYDIKKVKEAAIHEIGHTFGLSHRSTCSGTTITNQYDYGGGGFAPIMGCAYYQAESRWDNGTTAPACAYVNAESFINTILQLK